MSTAANVREFIELYQVGSFKAADRQTQIDAGWFDWFCNDSALANKTAKYGKRICMLADSPLIDLDRNYVFFKNCCGFPSLYDDVKFCDCETGQVLWVLSFDGRRVDIVDCRDQHDPRRVFTGNWSSVKKWMLSGGDV